MIMRGSGFMAVLERYSSSSVCHDGVAEYTYYAAHRQANPNDSQANLFVS